MNKAIFLDRDGTLNIDKSYVHKIEDWEFLEGVKEGLKILQNLGFLLIVITNQSGIGRGFYSEEDFRLLTNYVEKELKKDGIKISRTYFCPHINENCDCRKPGLKLFYDAQKDFDIDFSRSYAIGDKMRDLAICKKENIKGFLLDDLDIANPNIFKCKNLLEAARKIEEWSK